MEAAVSPDHLVLSLSTSTCNFSLPLPTVYSLSYLTSKAIIDPLYLPAHNHGEYTTLIVLTSYFGRRIILAICALGLSQGPRQEESRSTSQY